jgi:dihydrofolate reductase
MAKVIVGAAMSLDGFVADRNGDVSRLYPDLDALRKTEVLQESIRTTGAVLMGRRAYDRAAGDFTGYEYQVPIFVLTHRSPKSPAKGENERLSFIFVGDGIARAIERAKDAAGDRNVTVVGGASTTQQCLRLGLFDELHLEVVPVLLGDGLRLFERLGTQPIELERIQVSESPLYTHLRFRALK